MRRCIILAFIFILVGLSFWPEFDIGISQLFYRAGVGFFLKDLPIFVALHDVAYWGARILGVFLLGMSGFCFWRKRGIFGLGGRAWAFLFLALILGPALVANVVFKDQFGRARPREIVQFGGTSHYTAPFVITDQCHKNCSFVSGDGAFGFYLPTLAYVVAPKRRRRVFWGAMGAGGMFGLARIVMGAHFFSDVVFAGILMLATSALLYAVMFGRGAAQKVWRDSV